MGRFHVDRSRLLSKKAIYILCILSTGTTLVGLVYTTYGWMPLEALSYRGFPFHFLTIHTYYAIPYPNNMSYSISPLALVLNFLFWVAIWYLLYLVFLAFHEFWLASANKTNRAIDKITKTSRRLLSTAAVLSLVTVPITFLHTESLVGLLSYQQYNHGFPVAFSAVIHELNNGWVIRYQLYPFALIEDLLFWFAVFVIFLWILSIPVRWKQRSTANPL